MCTLQATYLAGTAHLLQLDKLTSATFICTAATAKLTAKKKKKLVDLRDALAKDLGIPAFMLQLVAITVQFLDESRNAQPLSEVFSETFRQD